MFRKLSGVLALVIVIMSIAVIGVQPVFADYSQSYEVYLGEGSSLAKIIQVDKPEYYRLANIKGESVRIDAEGFDLDNLLSDFDAEIKFSESVEGREIYYAYSPKIKDALNVRGQRINLQVAIAKEQVVLGSPLIFGSF